MQTRRDQCAHRTFLKIVPQNAPDCISGHIHFEKFSGGEGGLAPGPRKLVAFGHSRLLLQTMNSR